MKKMYKIAAFIVAIAITTITLTSGITKETSRYGGNKDLVEELYNQAVKENKDLGSIEDGIEKFYKKRNDAIEDYNRFSAYNNRYYADARSNANAIADATAKERTLEIINKSEAGYKTKIAGWQNIIASLNSKEKELNDLHTLLEIMITEKMIEKYQNNEMPQDAKIKEANNDLLKVIEAIKRITR